MINKDWSDQKTRETISSELGLAQNVFLAAGAGSGKTSSLVNRVMGLIGRGVPLSSVVAITFTREAARMFYGRITEELEAQIQKRAGTSQEKRYRDGLAQLDMAFFGTIDSFCRKLLMEFPAESGVPLDMSPLEKPSEKGAIIEDVLREMWQNQVPLSAYRGAVRLLDMDFKPEDLRRLLQYAMEEDTFQIELPPDSFFQWTQELRNYMEAARILAEELKGYYDKNILMGNNEEQRRGMTTKKSVECYRKAWKASQLEHPVNGVIFLDNMFQVFSYKEGKGKAKKPEQLLERALECLEDSRRGRIYEAYGENKYREAMSWVKEMQEAYLLACWGKSQISYQRSLCLLVEMLEKEAANKGLLLEYIRNKYVYYLVDEFQDTNPVQSRLFHLLTANRPGRLFIVGDEKQAIYRFRGGDVDNFHRVENDFSRDGESGVYQLARNFRSSAPLCQWFNDIFSGGRFFGDEFPPVEFAEKQKAFSEVDHIAWDGVYRYRAILPKKRTATTSAIPGTEEEQVLSLIGGLLNKPVSCYNAKEKRMTTRPLGYEDFMVVTSRKNKLDSYIELFREKGIPYQVAGRSNLESSTCLRMLTRLLAYLATPEDPTLRGRLMLLEPYSLSEKEYYRWMQGEGSSYALAVEEEINRLRSVLMGRPPTAIFRMAMEEMRLSYLTEAFQVKEEPDTLYYALELIRQGEEEGKIRDLSQLVRFLEEDILSGDFEYELSLTGKPKGVRLMNLHKTKGLEAPVVILADGAYSGSREPEKQYDYQNRTIRWFHIPNKNPGGPPMGKMVETRYFSQEKEEEERKLQEEDQRLLYVAATRAENILVIPEMYKNGGDDSPSSQPLAGDRKPGRWEDLLTEGLLDLHQKLAEAGDSPREKTSPGEKEIPDRWGEQALPSLDRESTYQTVLPSQVKSKEEPLSSQEEESGELLIWETSEEEAYRRRGRESTLLGTLVHHLMEALVSRLPHLPDQQGAAILVDGLLGFHGVSDQEEEFYRQVLLEVCHDMMEGGYSQEWAGPHRAFPQNLFSVLEKAEEIYTELPFSFYLSKDHPLMAALGEELQLVSDRDGYVNGVMDLVFRDAQGYVILDYKTNRSNEQLWQHYEPQLFLYQKILKEMLALEEDPGVYLYHIPVRKEGD